MAKIIIPTPLRKFTENESTTIVEVNNVARAFEALVKKFPLLKDQLYQQNGDLRAFLRIYVNDNDINVLQKEKTLLKQGDTVSIIPAIAGGKI